MEYAELQNEIIKRILEIQDERVLSRLKNLLNAYESESTYKLSDLEKEIIAIGNKAVKDGNYIANEDIFDQTEQWLNE